MTRLSRRDREQIEQAVRHMDEIVLMADPLERITQAKRAQIQDMACSASCKMSSILIWANQTDPA